MRPFFRLARDSRGLSKARTCTKVDVCTLARGYHGHSFHTSDRRQNAVLNLRTAGIFLGADTVEAAAAAVLAVRMEARRQYCRANSLQPHRRGVGFSWTQAFHACAVDRSRLILLSALDCSFHFRQSQPSALSIAPRARFSNINLTCTLPRFLISISYVKHIISHRLPKK